MSTHPSPGLHGQARLWRLVLSVASVLALLVTLPACSGGSDPTSPSGFPSAVSVEGSSFSLLNSARRDAGRDGLLLDPVLSDVARDYSRRMRDEGFFSHTAPDGSGPGGRVRAVGFTYRALAENLATVSGTADPASRAHDALLANAGHRRNMLDARYELVGVGVARDGDEYWITHLYLLP